MQFDIPLFIFMHVISFYFYFFIISFKFSFLTHPTQVGLFFFFSNPVILFIQRQRIQHCRRGLASPSRWLSTLPLPPHRCKLLILCEIQICLLAAFRSFHYFHCSYFFQFLWSFINSSIPLFIDLGHYIACIVSINTTNLYDLRKINNLICIINK